MSPRTIASYRVIRGQLVAVLTCGHAVKRSAPPKLDLRTLPRTARCPQCEKAETTPTRAA